MSRGRLFKALCFAAFAAACLVPAGATAQSQSIVRLSVSAGFGNQFAPNMPVPLTVAVESSRPVTGSLLFIGEDANSRPRGTHSIHIEVAAGGRKRFHALVQPSARLSVRFVNEKGSELGAAVVALSPINGTVAGVFGKVPPGLEALRRDIVQRQVRAAEVPSEWLSLGPQALAPLHYLLVDGQTMRTRSRADQQTLMSWVNSGGRLIVAGDGVRLDWLPSDWRPGPGSASSPAGAASASAGLGKVTSIPGTLAALPADSAFWNDLIVPHGRMFQPAASQDRSNNLPGILASSGSNRLRLQWLMAFLLVYVVVAGPVNYLVLKKAGKQERMWMTVPALAVVFSLIGLALAWGNRVPLLIRQGSVAFATPHASIGERLALVSSSSGGSRTMNFGAGFAAAGSNDGYFSSRSATTTHNEKGAQVEIETGPYEPAVATGSVPAVKGNLESTLTWDGGAFAGTLSNRTPYRFSDVFVMMGSQFTPTGALAPGETKQIGPLAPAPLVPPAGGSQFSGPRRQMSPQDRRAELTSALLSQFEGFLGGGGALGQPMVAGITSHFRPKLLLDGEAKNPTGGSLIASPVTILAKAGVATLPATAGALAPININGTVRSFPSYSGYSAPGAAPVTSTLALSGSGDSMFSWRLPTGLDPSRVKGVVLKSTVGQGHGISRAIPAPSSRFGQGSSSGSASVMVPAPGTAQVFRLEIFDWSNARWIGFDSTGAGWAHPVPTSVLKDGEALIKVSPGAMGELDVRSLGLEVGLL